MSVSRLLLTAKLVAYPVGYAINCRVKDFFLLPKLNFRYMAYKDYSTQSISHHIRQQLKVTCDEHCMLLYLHDCFDGKTENVFHFNAALSKHISKNLFFTLDEQADILRRLIDKKFLERKGYNILERTKLAIVSFKESEDEFEELWKYSGKTGNKALALAAYKGTVKVYPHKFLMERMKLYLAHLVITGHSQLHLSTFLNIKNKQFMNEFKSSKSIENEKGTFFK